MGSGMTNITWSKVSKKSKKFDLKADVIWKAEPYMTLKSETWGSKEYHQSGMLPLLQYIYLFLMEILNVEWPYHIRKK